MRNALAIVAAAGGIVSAAHGQTITLFEDNFELGVDTQSIGGSSARPQIGSQWEISADTTSGYLGLHYAEIDNSKFPGHGTGVNKWAAFGTDYVYPGDHINLWSGMYAQASGTKPIDTSMLVELRMGGQAMVFTVPIQVIRPNLLCAFGTLDLIQVI